MRKKERKRDISTEKKIDRVESSYI